MVLAGAGGVDHGKLCSLAEKYFAKVRARIAATFSFISRDAHCASASFSCGSADSEPGLIFWSAVKACISNQISITLAMLIN